MIYAVGVTRLAAIGAATAMLWLSPATAGEQAMPGATVESVVAIAKRLNPAVAAAALDFDAAIHKISTAGVLDDPTLLLQAWDVNSQGAGQRRIGFAQDIKLWGKYGLERDVAIADADAVKFRSRAVVIDLIARVVATHAEYNATYEAVRVTREIKQRYGDILQLLRNRYGTTSVDQQQIIRAEIEAATAEGDLVRRQGQLKAAKARLNALIGRTTSAPLAAPTGFMTFRNASLVDMQLRARSLSPLLALAGAQTRSANKSKSLTDLNYYPDVTVSAIYVQRPRVEDSGTFSLGFKVPLRHDVKDAEQLAAGARLSAAEARAEAIRLRVDGEVADVWFTVEALRKVIQIYTSRQLPPARSSVENARNGFQAGSSDIALFFESERRFASVQLGLLKLQVELQSKYAEMERLAGGLQ
ncbi:MAG: TolC family protein [Pseudomonadota bacterium]